MLIKLKKIELIAAVFSGILLGFCHPVVIRKISILPIDLNGYFGIISFFAYVPLLLIIKNKSNIKTFLLSFLTSFVHFFIVLHWIIVTLIIFGEINLFFSLIIFICLISLNSLYASIAFTLSNYFSRKININVYILNPIFVCAFIYFSNYGLFGGFPWGNIGYSLSTIPIFLQGASLFGVYGLVFFLILINATFAEIIYKKLQKIKFPLTEFIISSLFIVFFIIFGAYKLSDDDKSFKYVKIALLQGNIKQGIKNKQHFYYNEILQKYDKLQKIAIKSNPDIIIWPETSFPVVLPEDISYFIKFKYKTPTLIIGISVFKEELKNKSYYITYKNSAFIISHNNMKIINRVDKTHLVPFGEYTPWPLNKVIDNIILNKENYIHGSSVRPILISLNNKGKITIGITICFEGLFPEISRKLANKNSEIIINLTNDAWYGISSAPYQHLNIQRVRAVEIGRNIVRATNTGISAFIDYKGFIINKTKIYKEDIIIANIGLRNNLTIYSIIGDIVPIFSVIFIFIILFMFLIKKKF